MFKNPLTIIILVLVLGLALGLVFYLKPGINVKIENSQEYQETYYTVVEGKLKHQLTVYRTEINHNIVSYSSNAVSIQTQLKPLKAILTKLREKEGRLRPTFYWQSTKSYPEFYRRVAEAAAKSSLWDISQGKPFAGHENQAMIEIANQAKAYPELEKVFAEFGLLVRVSSVEKVIVDRVTKLPRDFMLWFRVEKN